MGCRHPRRVSVTPAAGAAANRGTAHTRSAGVERRASTRTRPIRARLWPVPGASRRAGATACTTANRGTTRARSTRVSSRAARSTGRPVIATRGRVTLGVTRLAASRPASVECRAGTRPIRVRLWPAPRASRRGPTAPANPVVAATMHATTVVTAVIRRTGSPRFNHTSTREHTRPLGSGNPRFATVYRSTQIVIAERHVLMLALHGREVNVTLVLGSQLASAWPRMQATLTAVEADTIHRDVVDHRPVIDVGDMNAAQVGHRPVVVKCPVAPVTALEADTTVSVTVVDTTVEAYMGPPIAGVPRIGAAAPGPVARRPQQTGGRRQHPRARHPVIVSIVIGPITRRPDVTDRGAGRLHIHRQRGRREVDRDADRNERKGRHWQGRQREAGQSGPGRSEATRFLIHADLVAIVD
jgi:hypothetical protein